MPKEIERKFLVTGEAWKKHNRGSLYRQGYLSIKRDCSVRIRAANEKGSLTIKGETRGATRDEFEYMIPLKDAVELLDNLCEKPLIEKRRYEIRFGGLTWEIDEFEGENKGLILAEVELKNENEKVDLPEWIGPEVTGDPKYYNVNLVKNPFSNWSKDKG